MTSLEDRVRRLEDRFEINDLLVRYAVLLDDRQFASVSRLFTEDGIFASPNSTTVGREEIARNFEAKHAPFTMTLHDPHASACFLTGDDEARGTVLGYAELANGDHTIVTNIRYQDDYRREDGAWKFARRHVLSVYGMTVADFVAGRAGGAERKRWPDRPIGAAECPDIEQRYAGYVVQP